MDAELESHPELVLITDSNLAVANPEEDIRGRKVIDNVGAEIGHVHDLLLDKEEGRVRFLWISRGGILGIGSEKFMLPVDAVTSISEDVVYIDQIGGHVAESPVYNPEMADRRYWDHVYAHYNFRPFYGKGYRYPGYPFYP